MSPCYRSISLSPKQSPPPRGPPALLLHKEEGLPPHPHMDERLLKFIHKWTCVMCGWMDMWVDDVGWMRSHRCACCRVRHIPWPFIKLWKPCFDYLFQRLCVHGSLSWSSHPSSLYVICFSVPINSSFPLQYYNNNNHNSMSGREYV